MRGFRPVLLLGLAAQSIGAFMQYKPPMTSSVISPSSSSDRLRAPVRKAATGANSRNLRPTVALRMRVGEDEALKSIASWGGAPKDCRLVCEPSTSDAGILSSFFKEVLAEKKGNVLLIAPNCDSASDAGALKRMSEYLNNVCPWANVQPLNGAPQPCLSFSSLKRPDLPPSPNSAKDLSNDQVMGKVLDWFTQMLISLDDEEEYVNIGRSLLSVSRYEVTKASSKLEISQEVWKEIQKMTHPGQEGNVIIVMPDFLVNDSEAFEEFLEKGVSAPLKWLGGRKLEVVGYHPKGRREAVRSPWPLVQISVYDPAPPRGSGDLTVKDELEAELGFDAEIETMRVDADQLRAAQAKKKGIMNPEPMPGFPLNLDELTDKGGNGFGKKP